GRLNAQAIAHRGAERVEGPLGKRLPSLDHGPARREARRRTPLASAGAGGGAMKAKEAIRKPPATIAAGASIAEAARQMNKRAVGALVVLDEGERPVGIVTD